MTLKEISMKSIRIVGIATITLFALLAAPQYDFAKVTTKKKKITVTVGADCGAGVSLSEGTSGNALCASYPKNAIGMLHEHVGQSIEIEAVFQYSGDSKDTPPTGIRTVTRVAGVKVYDPCSAGKSIMWGALAGLSGTPIGGAGRPPGCAESLGVGATPEVDDSSSAPPSAGTAVAMSTERATAIAPNVANASSRFTSGVPQCTRTQYENQGATLWIVNSCNIPVTVEMTSDSGNTWGQVDVGPNNRVAASIIGIGYSPQKDGTIYLFTCPKGAQPVLPNGNAFLARNYKGQFTCAKQ
jgi:hypothetical protein